MVVEKARWPIPPGWCTAPEVGKPRGGEMSGRRLYWPEGKEELTSFTRPTAPYVEPEPEPEPEPKPEPEPEPAPEPELEAMHPPMLGSTFEHLR